MVNKKYLLLTSLCSALAVAPALAQESGNTTGSYANRDMTYRGDSYDVLDSSYYTKGRMEQYRKFMNHQYNFPPRPRDMWEVGVNVGAFNVIGDVTSRNPFNAKKFTDAVGFGVNVRKSLGYFLSLRAQFTHGTASGYNTSPGSPNDQPWATWFPQTTPDKNPNVYKNYRTTANELSLQLVGATNNIKFHKGKNSLSLYGFVGGGVLMTRTAIDASTNGAAKSVPAGTVVDASYIKDTYLDGDYETYYQNNNGDTTKGSTLPVLVAGLGVQFKLGKRVSLSLEDKIGVTSTEVLDGVQYQENSAAYSSDKDLYNYLSVGLNFNIGNKAKNVAPLWWVNPLDYTYSEVADPRHMNLPEPVLSDGDNDGIADQFDKCPGTPAGVAVDTHGCPMDTDGDGVPDDRDKELITPTECQPVDADGVGDCPCPEKCGDRVGCSIGAGTISFSGSSAKIGSSSQAQLATLAAQMMAGPTCKVVLIGQGNASKVQQQRSWDRVNAIQEYMSTKHNIARDRFIFQYGQPGDANSVMYRMAQPGEDGPETTPPPFPNLSNQK